MSLNRRSFLTATGAVSLLGACHSSAPFAAASQKQIDKIGIQTYTLREALGEDFVGTFQVIKDIGYDYVELNRRDFSEMAPAELRTILDDIGLPAPITHVSYDALSEHPEQLADIAGELGCKHLIVPWLNDDQRGIDQYKVHADMLNHAGEALKGDGIKVGYHNHQFEFFDLGGGQTGMEILLSETDPGLVNFELDMFWAALTGTDIVALFEKHPSRFKFCHIKDLKGDASAYRNSLDFGFIGSTFMANVGEGELPFESYFAASEVSGMEYFIVEHDNPPQPFRNSVTTSYNSVAAMRF